MKFENALHVIITKQIIRSLNNVELLTKKTLHVIELSCDWALGTTRWVPCRVGGFLT